MTRTSSRLLDTSSGNAVGVGPRTLLGGACGLVVGRSIWKSDDPAGTVAAFSDIVHEGATVDEVWD